MNFDLRQVVAIAKEAGKEVMKVYDTNFDVLLKNDSSPLTEADTASNNVITKSLVGLYPNIPIISEENKKIPYLKRKSWKYFWLVDPLDGTKEFIKKNGEFTINIALVNKQKPVLGVVYSPAKNLCYFAKEGIGSFKRYRNKTKRIFSRQPSDGKIIVVASRNHLTKETEDFIAKLRREFGKVELVSMGSSLKFCIVAEGKADIYPRLGTTMEWDTAAAHAIINASGKKVCKFNSEEELSYNKKSLVNAWFVVK